MLKVKNLQKDKDQIISKEDEDCDFESSMCLSSHRLKEQVDILRLQKLGKAREEEKEEQKE